MRFSKLFVFIAVCIVALTFTSSAYAEETEKQKQLIIKTYEENLINADSDEIRRHYIKKIREIDPTNAAAQTIIYTYFDKEYAMEDALNILKIDPDNYVACSTLSSIYSANKNYDLADDYARRGILYIRKNFTPYEIESLTLTLVKDMLVIYPNDLITFTKSDPIYNLYSYYFYYRLERLGLNPKFNSYDSEKQTDIPIIKQYLKKFNIEVDDLKGILLVDNYSDEEI